MNFDGKVWTECGPDAATHLRINIPGPVGELTLPVGSSGWTWNKSVDKPTLSPSILTTSPHQGLRCHSYVVDGQVQFLADCSHEFKSQTIPLLEVRAD